MRRTTGKLYEVSLKAVTLCIACLFLAACGTYPADHSNGPADDHPAPGETNEFTLCDQDNGNSKPPGETPNAKDKWRNVCIVLDADNCPVETVYNGTVYAPGSDQGPGFETGGIDDDSKHKRVYWQAVTKDTSGPTAKYEPAEVGGIKIIFAPFKKMIYETNNKGNTQSGKLECVASSNCLPEDVRFKYTIWLDSNECTGRPMDPVIWINQ